MNEKQTFSVLPQSSAKTPTLDYLTREEALDILQVKRSTLYSYVSRGLIRCIKLNGNAVSHYALEDIKRLRAKSSARAGHGPVAAGAMRWGDPVILSSITAITPDGPRGPKYQVATGIIQLAQLTNAPIIPVSYDLSWKIALNSWDGFLIPLPFSRVILRIGTPVTVPQSADNEEREHKRLELETILKSLSDI